jgi:NAD(P)-dependent dehydrogenase (short-subunit alcohol dehydrogenase family)
MHDPEKFSLSGQVAVVTGAGAGIGRGIARVFAGAGAAVVVSDLKAETAKAVADEIVAAGGRATSLACNVTTEEDLQAVVDAAIAHMLNKRVRVNSVLIGTVMTAGYGDAGIDPEMQERLSHPDNLTGRLGRPEDVANAMLWLCSPAARWISGQTINVHGGGSVVRLFGK